MSQARTLWEEGTEPGRHVVALGLALAVTCGALDNWRGGDVGLFFDVTFVGLCVLVAMLVRPGDFFVAGVLPPLLMLVVFVVLALSSPGSIADPQAPQEASDPLLRALVAGLSRHLVALLVGFAMCLACLAVRRGFVGQSRVVAR